VEVNQAILQIFICSTGGIFRLGLCQRFASPY